MAEPHAIDPATESVRRRPPSGWRGRGMARAAGSLRRTLGLDEAAMNRLLDERPELLALFVQERAHTLRMGIFALVTVAALSLFIPLVNARPRLRRPDR